MIANNKKEQFVELRAKGNSFDKISKEIEVSKPTLIKWQREFASEIQNLKYTILDEMIEKFALAKATRLEFYLERLSALMEEMKSRKLSDLRTKELLQIVMELENKIGNDLTGIRFKTGEFEEANDPFTFLPAKTEKTLPLSY